MLITIITFLSFLFSGHRQSYTEIKNNSISNYAQISVELNELGEDPRISTVMLHKESWDLSDPIIILNSDERLKLSFDLLANNMETYYYTFTHCDKDWEESDLTYFDYIDGFPGNDIEDVRVSFNTTVPYYHYSLVFPNEDISFRISGNYLLKIYTEDPERPSLTRRFIVAENITGITASVNPPRMTLGDEKRQQVNFTVAINSANILDPGRNVYATILQNGRWDNASENLKPNTINDKELIYNSLLNDNIFYGGNEFRSFDIRDIHYKGENIRDIVFFSPNYNMYLNESADRGAKPYFEEPDFNGKFYVTAEGSDRAYIEADYMYVHFTFPYNNPVYGSKVYIFGDISNWKTDNRYVMEYDENRGEYTKSLLLKQGWYNFEYVLVDSQGKTDELIFEGSHYETENDYTIIIYYRNPRERYDRIIGYQSIKSRN
jgi:hypothetical protein